MEDSALMEQWEYDFEKRDSYAEWSFLFTNRPIDILVRSIVEGLAEYIRPVCLEIKAYVKQPNNKSRQSLNRQFINPIYKTSAYFNANEIISMMNLALKSIEGSDEDKVIMLSLSCKAYLTFTRRHETVSEWFPPDQFYEPIIQKNENRISMQGPIWLSLQPHYIGLTLCTNIWIPSSRNDELAVINGKQLTAILKTIEKIVQPFQIDTSDHLNKIHKYGYKNPEELFPNEY